MTLMTKALDRAVRVLWGVKREKSPQHVRAGQERARQRKLIEASWTPPAPGESWKTRHMIYEQFDRYFLGVVKRDYPHRARDLIAKQAIQQHWRMLRVAILQGKTSGRHIGRLFGYSTTAVLRWLKEAEAADARTGSHDAVQMDHPNGPEAPGSGPGVVRISPDHPQ